MTQADMGPDQRPSLVVRHFSSHSPPGRNLLLSANGRLETLMTMQNDQNRRPGFLENAMGHGSLVVVAIIAVVFVSMVLHLL
jgi:hypothetical protein